MSAAAASHRIGTGSFHGSPAGRPWRAAAQGEGRPDQSGDRADSALSSPSRSPATASELGRAGGRSRTAGWAAILGRGVRRRGRTGVRGQSIVRVGIPVTDPFGWRRRPCSRRAGCAVAGRTAARGDGGGWDRGRRVHPRSMGAVTPSRYGWCRSVSMSFPRCASEPEPLIEGHQRPPRRALPGRCR
jgi:hypothetical protein